MSTLTINTSNSSFADEPAVVEPVSPTVPEKPKTFHELLNEIIVSETFELELTDGNTYKFKQLTANHLKNLIKTIVDSPLTQAEFNTTASQIMEECFVSDQQSKTLNVVDRLLFIIESRIQAISPKLTLSKGETDSMEVDLNNIKNNLLVKIKENSNLFTSKEIDANGLKILCEIPSNKTDCQLNKELYKNLDIDVENPEELRKILGDSFINEIAKTINKVSIQNTFVDFTTTTFNSRIKTVETLPATAINSVIDYIEAYKEVVDKCLTVEGNLITIDGSLFSLR